MTGKLILIADDDFALLAAIRIRLEAEGYRVVVAQDAYQALARARDLRPDLLVLDVNMPAGKGFSVHQRIAKIDELANTPVLYITGECADSIERSAARLGARTVLHKPFATTELLEAITDALCADDYHHVP